MNRERGMVTAEAATLAPFGVALTLLLVWLVSLGVTQVRLVDAAREGARLVARGDDRSAAEAVVRRNAPAGARIDVTTADGTVTVRVSSTARLPLPFLEDVGGRRLTATAVAAAEAP